MKKADLAYPFLVSLIAFAFISCERGSDIKKVDLTKVKELETEAKEPARIRIGLVPEQDIRNLSARYEPLAAYLSNKLGVKVTLVYLDSYGEACDKFIYKQLDAGFFGSFSYALTHVKAGVLPIARPDYQGVSTYRGLIIAREDSNIKNTADMKNKRLALVSQATYAGYLYPLAYFKEQGIDNIETYFSEVKFSASHDKAVFWLLRGEVDVACLKDLVYQRLVKESPDIGNKLAVLSVSMPVPSNALCVSKDLAVNLKDKLKDALLNLHNDREGLSVLESLGADRFIETKDKDYESLYQTIKALGIDLNTYPYYSRPDMGFDISN